MGKLQREMLEETGRKICNVYCLCDLCGDRRKAMYYKSYPKMVEVFHKFPIAAKEAEAKRKQQEAERRKNEAKRKQQEAKEAKQEAKRIEHRAKDIKKAAKHRGAMERKRKAAERKREQEKREQKYEWTQWRLKNWGNQHGFIDDMDFTSENCD